MTMPAKMMSEMPLPMPRSVICSPSHMMKAVPVVSVIIVMKRKPQPGWVTTCAELRVEPVVRLEPARDDERLEERQDDRAVARVLVDLASAPARPPCGAPRGLGTTTVSSCRMMDALMYGMMPSAKIDSCSSAPPENMLKKPRNAPDAWLHDLRHDARSTPGVVTKTPMR